MKDSSYLIEFERAVSLGGYRWIDARADGNKDHDRWLVRNIYDHSRPLPHIERDLFLMFAELPLDDESALAEFAGREGRLGSGELVHPVDDDQEFVGHGESLKWWLGEIRAMRTMVSLAAAIRGGDSKALTAGLSIEPVTHRVGRENHTVWDVRYDAGFGSTPRIRVDEQIKKPKAGRLVIQSTVRKKLQETTQLDVVLEGRTLVAKVRVQTLLGRMWLQFLDNVTDGSVRTCSVCRRPFVSKRPNNTACGRNCVQRAYDQRQAKAIAKKGR